VEVLDYGKSDELEKTSDYGPTNYRGPSVPDYGYQHSSWDQMNVTYSPKEDKDFEKQNGSGGYPNRFFTVNESPYYSNTNKIVKMMDKAKCPYCDSDDVEECNG
jgi:hypothetical protein